MTLISATARTQLPLGWTPPATPFAPILPRLPGPLAICCVGTSITWGTATTSNNSYRLNLYNLGLQAGLTFAFSGRTNTGTAPANLSEGVVGSTLPDHMSGGSVDTVAWLAGLAPASRPKVLLHELGINDSSSGPLTTAFAANMATYIGQLEAIQAFRHVWSVCPNRGQSSLNANLSTIQNAILTTVPTIAAGGTSILYCDSRWLSGVSDVSNPAHYEGGAPAWIHPADAGDLFKAWSIFSGILLASGRLPTWAGDQNP
jgi:hypothetical protein